MTRKITIKRARVFSEEFKKTCVKDYESGQFTVKELSGLYQIQAMIIYRWIYKYSAYNKRKVRVVEMADSSKQKLKELHKKIADLERIVGQKQLNIDFLEKMIELAKDNYGIDIKKKLRYPTINWFRENIRGIGVSMNSVYQICGVSKQAVYKHNNRTEADHYRLNELIIQVDEIRSIHPGCGLEKLYDSLQPDWLGRDKFIAEFMNLGYRVRKIKNYKRTTIPSVIYYPNLIEGLLVWNKNRVWQTDITYYEINGTFFYLVFIIDIYTKVIRGYQVSNHMRAVANIEALRMALREAKEVAGLIHHSDRGSQFINNDYRELLKKKGIHMSMGLIAQDNAYAERVNGIIKNEYLRYKGIDSFIRLKHEVKIAVDHYNTKRIHRHLPGKQTPRQFENELINLSTQNRPKVIVYAEGNSKIRTASSRSNFNPETEPQDHVCPMVIN